MRRSIIQFGAGLMTMMIITSCSNSEDWSKTQSRHQEDLNPNIELTRGEEAAMESISDFSYQLAKETYCLTPGENLCISPISAGINLGIIANATTGDCRDEIIHLLGEGDLCNLNTLCQKLMRYLPCDENGSSMQLFNKVWLADGLQASSNLCNALGEFYYTDVENLDFSNPKSIVYMNNWIAKATGHKLGSIVDDTDIDMSNRFTSPFITTNAIYFKGDWDNQFDKASTSRGIFKSAIGDVETTMMHAKEFLTYSTNEHVEAVIIYFEGNANGMILYLPKEGVTIEEALASFTTASGDSLWQSASESEVDLSMPKFQVESRPEVDRALQNMGLVHLKDADLTPVGISKTGLTTYQHTYLKVDEEGAEAAAYTQSKIDIAYMPEEIKKVKLEFNRPFIYEIKNFRTNAVLLSGVINKL